jgi:hypothetical protein
VRPKGPLGGFFVRAAQPRIFRIGEVKFFVPYAADDAHSEQIWSDSRSDLLDLGLPTTKRRIWALSMHSSGGHHLLNIGRQFDPDEGPALIIFEASNRNAYYVCTPWRGVLGGEPHVLELCRQGRAIDFEEAVEGLA